MNIHDNDNLVNEPAMSYGLQQNDITDISMLDMSKVYTYANYLTWKFKERVELIKGRIFRMSPAPARMHQKISGKFFLYYANFLEGKKCEVYSAPFDVRFPSNISDKNPVTVVQPDICVICDLSKLDDKGCNGAPDLIIEILSPSTAAKDTYNKFELFQEHGVSEYWIVDPANKIVDVFVLNSFGKYELIRKFNESDKVQVNIFPDLIINMADVFAE